MPEGSLERAERCLSKAVELRELADKCKLEQTREALLGVAESYEKIAETIRLLNQTGLRWSDEDPRLAGAREARQRR
jgi:hypothetical protein